MRNVLLDAKMDSSEVDEVVLVGGSTRIPKVHLNANLTLTPRTMYVFRASSKVADYATLEYSKYELMRDRL